SQASRTRTGPMMERNREMSPHFLARMVFVLATLEGLAQVWGQLRIPGRLVVSTGAAATAANILQHESLFPLGLALSVLAVAFNAARMAASYVLFRPVGRNLVSLAAFFGLVATALQAGSVLFELPVLIVLKSGRDLVGFDPEQLQSLALLFLKW